MNPVLPKLHYWIRRWGLPLTGGVVLIVAALVLELAVVRHDMQRLATLSDDMRTMQTQSAQRRQAWLDASPQAAVHAFFRALPPESTSSDQIENLFDAAYENNLAPQTGEFVLIREPGAGFSRYQVTLPVQGTYPDLRKFANRVLEEIPSAALESITLSRENLKTNEVDANLQFTIYLRSAG